MKTYKELVQATIEITNGDSFNNVCGRIDNAFQNEKISWKDHEQLYAPASTVGSSGGIY